MDKYTIITCKSYDEIKSHFENWESLYYFLELPISYSPAWLLAWLNSYLDETLEIDITFVYKNDNLVAVVPFMIRKEKQKLTLKFLSDSCSDYLGIPFSKDVENDIVNLILEQFKRISFTSYDFSNIHEKDITLPILISALFNYGLHVTIQAIEKSLKIELDDEYDKKFKSIISQRKYSVKLRDIEELGAIRFEVIHSCSESFLEEVFKIHIDKWTANKVFPQFSDERREKFIAIISKKFISKDKFTVFGLFINDKLVAYRLGITHNSVYYDWNTAFDYNIEKYAPGIVLLVHLIKHLLSEGYTTFDFLNGNEKYKYIWSTKISNVYKLLGECDFEKGNIIEAIDTPKIKNIVNKKCLILDIHGIIYKGVSPITATINGIKKLQDLGIRIGILTNTSGASAKDIQAKFSKSGLQLEEKVIMTSSIAIIEYLLEKKIKSCFLIGGEPELQRLLKLNNIEIIKNPDVAKAVVIGFSKKFNYNQLTMVCEALRNGAEFICSDADMLFAADGQNLPGTGWIVSSISSVSNKKPFIVGKPNSYSLKLLLNKMNVKISDIVFIGDSLESDIKTGKILGVTTCLHLGGVSQLDDVKILPTSQKPDFIIHSFDEITEVFEKISK